MTTLREAAQQALEAWDQPHGINYVDFRPYMDALRAALAEPVQPETMTLQEVWNAAGGNSGIKPTKKEVLATLRLLDEVCDEAEPVQEPLTEEEIERLYITAKTPMAFARAIEAAHGIGSKT